MRCERLPFSGGSGLKTYCGQSSRVHDCLSGNPVEQMEVRGEGGDWRAREGQQSKGTQGSAMA